MNDLEFKKNHLTVLYTGLKSALEQLESVSLQAEAILFSLVASVPEFGREYERRHNILTSNADDAFPSPLLKQIDDNLQSLTHRRNTQ